MENTEIYHEKIFEIMVLILRITSKFNELEKMSIDIGSNEKIYPSELHVIDSIARNNGKSVTELSKKFGITKGAVSQVVNKLFAKGFLKKDKKIGSSKEIVLSLTEKGWKAFNVMDQIHKQMENEFFGFMSNIEEEKLESFIEIMGKIEEFIDTFLKHEL